jgi:hypothetical protein
MTIKTSSCVGGNLVLRAGDDVSLGLDLPNLGLVAGDEGIVDRLYGVRLADPLLRLRFPVSQTVCYVRASQVVRVARTARETVGLGSRVPRPIR